MTEQKKELFKALHGASKDIQGVLKSSRNDFAKHNYASAESMIRESRVAYHNHGLHLAQIGQSYDPGTRVLGQDYRLSHHESGESDLYHLETPVLEATGRPLDKAVNVASTQMLGYFLRGNLLLPRVEKGDELDNNDRMDEPAEDVGPRLRQTYESNSELCQGILESRFGGRKVNAMPKADQKRVCELFEAALTLEPFFETWFCGDKE